MAINDKTIGTCGNCGGAVKVPAVWHGVNPPVPQCESCGATPKVDNGPVIPMNPGPARRGLHIPTKRYPNRPSWMENNLPSDPDGPMCHAA